MSVASRPAAPLRDDYAGAFDPDLDLAGFSRAALARLGRETLLHGHLQDRVGIPLVMQALGGDAYLDVAIEEWMAASPIYSRRMQRALGFEGDDVGTVFRNLQLDIGAPHQFMDFRFRLDAPDRGEFWLDHCGALLDVEPFGEKRVIGMCHQIEDPTFDATAAATHPRMKMRPIHRPPRVPAGREPACRWRVFIDPTAEPFTPHPNLDLVAASKLATLPIEAPDHDAEPGGWPDYAGPFDPDFALEDLCHRALVRVNDEFALQSLLLARAFLLAVGQRVDAATTARIGAGQWTGIAILTAERLRHAMAIDGDDIEAAMKLFQMHPCFRPRAYLDFRVDRSAADRARIEIRDCPALEEGDACSWFAGLGAAPHPALDGIAGVVNPHARCMPVPDPRGARWAWDIVIDPSAPPRPPPRELALARLSRGAGFRFETRRPVRR